MILFGAFYVLKYGYKYFYYNTFYIRINNY